jgi:hypothetical protein
MAFKTSAQKMSSATLSSFSPSITVSLIFLSCKVSTPRYNFLDGSAPDHTPLSRVCLKINLMTEEKKCQLLDTLLEKIAMLNAN